MQRLVPAGSMWLVKAYVPESQLAGFRERGEEPPPYMFATVRAYDKPQHQHFREPITEVAFRAGELLVVGHTVMSRGGGSIEFVEVLSPRHAFINRLHFNEGSLYLARVA